MLQENTPKPFLSYTPCKCSHCREYQEHLAGKAEPAKEAYSKPAEVDSAEAEKRVAAKMWKFGEMYGMSPTSFAKLSVTDTMANWHYHKELQRNERKLSFLLSLTPIQRKHLHSHLIAFKTFASRKFGRATRCTIVILQGSFPMIGFRAYRNGVPTEVPGTNCAYNTFKQCYPLHQDVLNRERVLWEC